MEEAAATPGDERHDIEDSNERGDTTRNPVDAAITCTGISRCFCAYHNAINNRSITYGSLLSLAPTIPAELGIAACNALNQFLTTGPMPSSTEVSNFVANSGEHRSVYISIATSFERLHRERLERNRLEIINASTAVGTGTPSRRPLSLTSARTPSSPFRNEDNDSEILYRMQTNLELTVPPESSQIPSVVQRAEHRYGIAVVQFFRANPRPSRREVIEFLQSLPDYNTICQEYFRERGLGELDLFHRRNIECVYLRHLFRHVSPSYHRAIFLYCDVMPLWLCIMDFFRRNQPYTGHLSEEESGSDSW